VVATGMGVDEAIEKAQKAKEMIDNMIVRE
jgi:hypothetical protein